MSRLATLELDAGGGRVGRALLPRSALGRLSLAELEAHFAASFIAPDDVDRLQAIHDMLDSLDLVDVPIFPGETAPPEYHVYFRDPAHPGTRLFGFVLVPQAVASTWIDQPPNLVLETACLQVMSGNDLAPVMYEEVRRWIKRVWPEHRVPALRLLPWPLESESDAPPERPIEHLTRAVFAPVALDVSDYATPEELQP